MARILVIDDSAVMRDLLSDWLSDTGHLVDVAADGEDGLKKALKNSYDICICDMHMPKLNGFEVLSAVVPRKPEMEIVFTDSLPDQTSESVRQAGSYYTLRKPFELDQLREILDRILKPIRTE
ncbi:MAG: response regulator [Planctomycetota bacterium]